MFGSYCLYHLGGGLTKSKVVLAHGERLFRGLTTGQSDPNSEILNVLSVMAVSAACDPADRRCCGELLRQFNKSPAVGSPGLYLDSAIRAVLDLAR